MTTEPTTHLDLPSANSLPVCAPGWLCLQAHHAGHWLLYLRSLSLPRRDVVRATMVCDDFGNLVAVSDAALDAAYYAAHCNEH